ncbi:hypothetical protein E2C01_026043 [Portunus trituberculatus]|uniref:Uncharacterized protein n=1 Tax=Portunus trituberculatus TaxID=210409 RepID=A0A5B7EH30_PORTR|nr:hypothetical protein [Portunus trituberculatus]
MIKFSVPAARGVHPLPFYYYSLLVNILIAFGKRSLLPTAVDKPAWSTFQSHSVPTTEKSLHIRSRVWLSLRPPHHLRTRKRLAFTCSSITAWPSDLFFRPFYDLPPIVFIVFNDTRPPCPSRSFSVHFTPTHPSLSDTPARQVPAGLLTRRCAGPKSVWPRPLAGEQVGVVAARVPGLEWLRCVTIGGSLTRWLRQTTSWHDIWT